MHRNLSLRHVGREERKRGGHYREKTYDTAVRPRNVRNCGIARARRELTKMQPRTRKRKDSRVAMKGSEKCARSELVNEIDYGLARDCSPVDSVCPERRIAPLLAQRRSVRSAFYERDNCKFATSVCTSRVVRALVEHSRMIIRAHVTSNVKSIGGRSFARISETKRTRGISLI